MRSPLSRWMRTAAQAGDNEGQAAIDIALE